MGPEEIECRTCGVTFEFRHEEQEEYKSRNFQPPKRCHNCRLLKKLNMYQDQPGNLSTADVNVQAELARQRLEIKILNQKLRQFTGDEGPQHGASSDVMCRDIVKHGYCRYGQGCRYRHSMQVDPVHALHEGTLTEETGRKDKPALRSTAGEEVVVSDKLSDVDLNSSGGDSTSPAASSSSNCTMRTEEKTPAVIYTKKGPQHGKRKQRHHTDAFSRNGGGGEYGLYGAAYTPVPNSYGYPYPYAMTAATTATYPCWNPYLYSNLAQAGYECADPSMGSATASYGYPIYASDQRYAPSLYYPTLKAKGRGMIAKTITATQHKIKSAKRDTQTGSGVDRDPPQISAPVVDVVSPTPSAAVAVRAAGEGGATNDGDENTAKID